MSEKGTEAGSPQKKLKAKQKGDSVRSRELLSAVAMLSGVLVLGVIAKSFVHDWRVVLEQSLTAAGVNEPDGDQRWSAALRRMIAPAMLPVGIVMSASFVAALAAGVAQGGGLSIHPDALGMKFNRLNPLTNLSNMFSLRSATRLVKSLVPAAAMVLFGWLAVKALMIPMPVMSTIRLPSAFSAAYGLAIDASWLTLAWSGLDYIVEWMAWNKRMKMTKQEVKDEMKQAMGNPQVKGRIRQVQNAMRRRRVKADISRASVVITNPTHYAVALEFSFETMSAPTVLAKGRDLHAAAIREEAQWAGIPMIENPPLARSLYRAVEPGQTIPFELYATVASILAFLYRQKVEEKVREQKQREARKAGVPGDKPVAAGPVAAEPAAKSETKLAPKAVAARVEGGW
jgi:flagellar biosynthetic protein FlhB